MTNDDLCRVEYETPRNDLVLQLCHEYRLMSADQRGIVMLLHDVIRQSCQGDDGVIDSMALSAYADAIRFLAEEGKLRIETDIGRRVIAREKKIEAEEESE